MSKHLFIIAQITPKPIFLEAAKAALLDIVEPTRQEPGCYQFAVHHDSESLYLYEEWENQAALDRHYAMPYVTPVFEFYKEWLAAPVDIKKLVRLA